MGGVPVLLLFTALAMGIASGLRAEEKGSGTAHVAMKPDPQTGGSGGGFTFPSSSVPPSLMDDAAANRDKFDKAGRPIQDTYNQAAGNQAAGNQAGGNQAGGAAAGNNSRSALVPPPSTRTSGSLGTNFAAPPFTGPTTNSGQRDNTWSSEAARLGNPPATTSPRATPASGFGAPSATNASDRQAMQYLNGQNAAAQNSNGLRPNDTFGRLPSGLSGTNGSTANGFKANGSNAMGFGNDENPYGQQSASANPYGVQQYATQQEQVLADQRAAQQRQLQAQRTQPRQTQPRQPPSFGDAGSFANDAASTGAGNYRAATKSTPDTRLTDTQLRSNAWSVDDYGRIFDQQGKYMPSEQLQRASSLATNANRGDFDRYPDASMPASGSSTLGGQTGSQFNNNDQFSSNDRFAQAPSMQVPSMGLNSPNFAGSSSAYPSTDTRSNQNSSPFASANGYANPGTSNGGFGTNGLSSNGGGTGVAGNGFSGNSPSVGNGFASATSMTTADYDRLARLEREAELAQARRRIQDNASISQTDPQINTAGLGSSGSERPPQVATDSLFKLLLLISIFGNVYLAFWLKNMRIKFRDMVTTKRLANSNAAAS